MYITSLYRLFKIERTRISLLLTLVVLCVLMCPLVQWVIVNLLQYLIQIDTPDYVCLLTYNGDSCLQHLQEVVSNAYLNDKCLNYMVFKTETGIQFQYNLKQSISLEISQRTCAVYMLHIYISIQRPHTEPSEHISNIYFLYRC